MIGRLRVLKTSKIRPDGPRVERLSGRAADASKLPLLDQKVLPSPPVAHSGIDAWRASLALV